MNTALLLSLCSLSSYATHKEKRENVPTAHKKKQQHFVSLSFPSSNVTLQIIIRR
jgi:hypothetical protein